MEMNTMNNEKNGMQRPPFHVAMTADFRDESGTPKFADVGLGVMKRHPHIEVSSFDQHRSIIEPQQINGAHGVVVLTPHVTGDSIAGSADLLAIGRFGVGYDSVDVEACTRNNVLAMITSGAVDRSMAEATLTWMLALTHHVIAKDRLVRTGCWDDRTRYMGREIRDRTLGVIGLGGIGRQLVTLLRGMGMRQPVVYDPLVAPELVDSLGVRLVSLDELLSTADFVSLHCPLNSLTRGLIGARELSLMKRDAWLLNTARGGIVNEDALFSALTEGRIAGAALDCFETEPLRGPSRFGELDNVVLAPHSISWTAEMFRDIGRAACQSMVDISLGRRPNGVLNPELLERPAFLQKWARVIGLGDPGLLNLPSTHP
jgi:phosphoglycerate dehydrogenase-like enzyme